ncbi:hypothetical protein CDIK_3934 [Cucumispora dikerogammari]|nr:hypothetical protein CDIK_3934 [Cucumispora dikerogammari]
MLKKNTVKNQEEYNNIKNFLLNGSLSNFNDKKSKKRFISKEEDFLVVENLLYKKEVCGNHKRVIHEMDLETMRIECALVHKQTHMGYNKTEQFINDNYFTIKREVVRSVCKSCEACAITEPLKKTLPLINIKA